MKYIFVLLFLTYSLFGSVIKTQVISVDEKTQTLKINIKKINVGMSGFVFHQFAPTHSSIINNVSVKSFDEDKGVATLSMSKYNDLAHSALPKGKWKTKVGDTVVLAFAYSRALLIAPTEEIYYRITKSADSLQWVHSDLFATILSFQGHPTPLKEDFERMAKATSVGLVFFYLDKQLYTVDIRSFKILNISPAPLTQDGVKLPFYSRIDEINAAWWGEGSDEIEDYEIYYYGLLVKYNKQNKKLLETIKNGDEKLKFLVDEFEIKE